MEPLLQYPKPRDDEWLGSWIFRTARANETSLRQLVKHLGWADSTSFPDGTRLLQLASATRTPISRIEQMLKPQSSLIEFPGRKGTQNIQSFLGVSSIQICPLCIAQDQVPYFRLSWLMREIYSCPVHRTTMIDACPHCDASIMPRGAQFMWKRRELDKHLTFQNDLRRCRKCNGDLGDLRRPLLTLSGLLNKPPANIGRRLAPTELEWSTLVENTRRLVSHDGLYRFIDLETLTLRFGFESFPPPLSPSKHQSAEYRFGKELLTDILLGPRADDRRTIETRMEAFGMWLLAIRAIGGTKNLTPTRLFRFWIANSLIHASEAGLLREWPVLVNTLLDLEEHKVEDPRPVSRAQVVALQPQEWRIMSVGLEDSLAWRTVERRKRLISSQDIIQGFLWFLSNNVGGSLLPSMGYPDFFVVRYWINVWTNDGRLATALGLLYKNMMQNRPNIFLSPEEDPDSWHARTAIIFLSNGMIELLRTVHPALHRELLNRLVERVSLSRC